MSRGTKAALRDLRDEIVGYEKMLAKRLEVGRLRESELREILREIEFLEESYRFFASHAGGKRSRFDYSLLAL